MLASSDRTEPPQEEPRITDIATDIACFSRVTKSAGMDLCGAMTMPCLRSCFFRWECIFRKSGKTWLGASEASAKKTLAGYVWVGVVWVGVERRTSFASRKPRLFSFTLASESTASPDAE